MNWSSLGSGLEGNASALRVFDDGNGAAIYVGGCFTSAGGHPASNLAKWDGSSWSSLGLGTSGSVYNLNVFNDVNGQALYAAGQFRIAGGLGAKNVAKWDGLGWSALASGIGGSLANTGVRAWQAWTLGRAERSMSRANSAPQAVCRPTTSPNGMGRRRAHLEAARMTK